MEKQKIQRAIKETETQIKSLEKSPDLFINRIYENKNVLEVLRYAEEVYEKN